jgi:hypothetical protein
VQDICPSASKDHHVYLRILHEACVVLGGEHHLARRLGVSPEEVDAWLKGHSLPPDHVFLACLDIVQGHARRL